MGAYGSPDLYPYSDDQSIKNNRLRKNRKSVFTRVWFWVVVAVSAALFYFGGADLPSLFMTLAVVSLCGFCINLIRGFVGLITKKEPGRKFGWCGIFFIALLAAFILFGVVSGTGPKMI